MLVNEALGVGSVKVLEDPGCFGKKVVRIRKG
jgi:hypothetical protein